MPPASNKHNWQRVEDLFYAALDLGPSDRSAFLDSACGEDRALREEINSLLKSSEQTLGFARDAVFEVAQRQTDGTLPVGTRIGAYQLLRVLGKGGMGTVYLSERADNLYEQSVAIKLMHAGFSLARSMRLRFSAEQQILANLNHPNIARLLDGGITTDGLPYLVMEHVNGIPVDEYCRQNHLSTENVIKLFLKICAAVEYAHQNLVIHRDLKPGNILVTSDGVPKLLDFGIAKLLDGELSSSNLTQATERMMTPEYASPEQVRGKTVTTATDVYALGVLLYELLCGVRPFQVDRKSPLEVLTVICEQYPDPPSKILSTSSRLTHRGDYHRFRDDLDNIVMMAMRKEPERRYASVALFASDLRRCLDGFPVLARTDSWTYSGGKFIRRHKVAVIAVTTSVVALISFSIGMGILAKRATQARLVAEQQRLAARQEADFLANIFQAATPEEAKGQQITARELLDAGVKRIDRELASVPEVQATMLSDIGRAYTLLGLYDEAKPVLERAYAFQRRVPGRETLDFAATADGLARLYRLEGEYEKAEPIFREALAVREKIAGPNNELVADSMNSLGECLYWEGHDAEAERLLRQALTLDGKPDSDVGAATRNYLALDIERSGKFDEAAQLLREAVDISRKIDGEGSPNYAIDLQNLGGALINLGNLNAAEETERRSLQVRRAITGEDHPDIAYTLNLLGVILLEKGEWAQAEAPLMEALTVRQKLLGEQHPLYAGSLSNLARVMQAEGGYEAARRMFQKALQILQDAGKSESWSSARILSYLGLLELDQRNYSDAERYARQGLEMQRKLYGEESPDVAYSLLEVGVIREFQGDLAGAEPMFREALEIRQKELRLGHPSIIAAEVRLGEALIDEGKLDLAEPLLSDAKKSAHNSPFPLLPWQIAEADGAMGAYLVKRGNTLQGETLLRTVPAAMKNYPEAAMRRRILERTAGLEQGVQRTSLSERHF